MISDHFPTSNTVSLSTGNRLQSLSAVTRNQPRRTPASTGNRLRTARRRDVRADDRTQQNFTLEKVVEQISLICFGQRPIDRHVGLSR